MAPRWTKVKYAKITWTKLNFEDIFEEGVKSHLHALSCMTITLCINNDVKEFLKLQLKYLWDNQVLCSSDKSEPKDKFLILSQK